MPAFTSSSLNFPISVSSCSFTITRNRIAHSLSMEISFDASMKRRTRLRLIDTRESHCGRPSYGVDSGDDPCNSRGAGMCRNIKTLANFAPPATDDELRASALQFVRKVSGAHHPSRANELAFNRAVEE